MIRRIARTEFLRGVAAPLTLVLLAVSLGLLLWMPTWVGNWAGLAAFLRSGLVWGWPVLVALGAWVGARDREHGIDELKRSTPRPRWHPVVASWLALMAGALTVFGITWLVGAAFAALATYSSGNWEFLLLVCLSMLAAGAALGMLIGRLFLWRWTAPLAGLGAVVANRRTSTSSVGFLVPRDDSTLMTEQYPLDLAVGQVCWFAAVTAFCLLLVGPWRRRFVIVVAATSASMLYLLAYPLDRYKQADPISLGSVCTPPGIQVCVPRYQGYVIDDYLRLREPVQARLRGIAHVPTRLDVSVPPISMEVSLVGDFVDPVKAQATLVYSLVSAPDHCVGPTYTSRAPAVAHGWILREMNSRYSWYRIGHLANSSPEVDTKLAHLLKKSPLAQRDWMSRFFTATRNCDEPALRALMDTT